MSCGSASKTRGRASMATEPGTGQTRGHRQPITAMGSLNDIWGLPVSTPDAVARDLVDAALMRFVESRGGVGKALDAALRRDPGCAIALCFDAANRLLAAERAGDPAIARALARFERVGDRANDRERRHAAAARAWFDGELHEALRIYDALLVDHPRDGLALQLAHALDFRLGQREMLRDRVAQVLPQWRAGMPGFGHVLAMYAFGLEETGDYARAEAFARRSLEAMPGHAAAIHVIAHVLEMQGRAQEGIRFLESTHPHWAANDGFALHVAWHLALCHLDRDDATAALAIYDATLRPTRASSMAGLVDATALLWRLELCGLPLRRRWRELARCWKHKSLAGARAFNLVHAVASFAAARHDRLAGRVIEALRGDTATKSANEPDDLALAIPVCEALRAFGRGDYALAVEKIGEVRAIAAHCGGSVAQCDLIHLTFIEAALRSRRARLAQALAAERAARKPDSLLNRWFFRRARAVA
jgi:tetratricopeptide (TPR) repeat protein